MQFIINNKMQTKPKDRVKKAEVVYKQVSHSSDGSAGWMYFLGVIGAATYYISTSNGFWMGTLGLLKALVWPAFLVFEILKFLAV